MDTSRIYKGVTLLLLLSIFSTPIIAAIAGGNGSAVNPYIIDSCGQYSDPGYYILTSSLSNPSTSDSYCLKFLEPVSLDCQGHYIYVNTSDISYGVLIDSANNTNISNCHIEDKNGAAIGIIESSNIFIGSIYADTYYGVYAYTAHTCQSIGGNITIKDSTFNVGRLGVMEYREQSIIDPNPQTQPIFKIQNTYIDNTNGTAAVYIFGENESIHLPVEISLQNTQLHGTYGTAVISADLVGTSAYNQVYISSWNPTYITVPTPPSQWELLFQDVVGIGSNNNLSQPTTITWQVPCDSVPLGSTFSAEVWDGSKWIPLATTTNTDGCPYKVSATVPVEDVHYNQFIDDDGSTYNYSLIGLMYQSGEGVSPSKLENCPIAIEVMYSYNKPATNYNVSIHFSRNYLGYVTNLDSIGALNLAELERVGFTITSTTDSQGIACFNQTTATFNGITLDLNLRNAKNATQEVIIKDDTGHTVYDHYKYMTDLIVIVLNPFLSFTGILTDALLMGLNLYVFFAILGILFVTQFGFAKGAYYGGALVLIMLMVLNVIHRVSIAQTLLGITVFGITIGLISWVFGGRRR